MVYELVDYGVDEVVAERADQINVIIQQDNVVMVRNNGPGIPVNLDTETQKPILELLMTQLWLGRWHYTTSSGSYGVGLAVVNALSAWARVEVHRDGQSYTQEYCEGLATGLMASGRDEPTGKGTTIYFQADPAIFETTDYEAAALMQRFRELCYLTPGLTITFHDQRPDREHEATFYFQHGIRTWVQHLNRARSVLHTPLYVGRLLETTMIEVALQYTVNTAKQILTFVNNANTTDGGTHLTGFQLALTRTLNTYARQHGLLLANESPLTAADTGTGLTAIVSVMMKDPFYCGSLKYELGNPEVRGQVQAVVGPALYEFLTLHPAEAQRIIAQCVDAARAREARKAARSRVKKAGTE
jgi:DNA gyrase subunit B